MWRLVTSIFRSSVEKFALLCLVVLVTVIVVSVWMYEDTTGPDAELIRQQHQYQLEEMLREEELLVRQFQLEKLKRSQMEDHMEDHILGSSTTLPTTDRYVQGSGIRTVVRSSSVPLKRDYIGRSTTIKIHKRRKDEFGLLSKGKQTDSMLGGLQGGTAQCITYDTTENLTDAEFTCIVLSLKPNPSVCLFPIETDIYISKTLSKEGLWESHILQYFQTLLSKDPGLGFYDIGANVGTYSLLAASMGHKVVAVEPYLPSLKRMHKAIKLGKLENKMIVLQNAVSDDRATFELFIPSDNQGGARLTQQDADRFCVEAVCPHHATTILMDDLLEVTNFERAILKIDIEGHEHRAFVHSEQLFKSVHIEYIFMEWVKLREYYGAEVDTSDDKDKVFEMIEMLDVRGYIPKSLIDFKRLSLVHWYGWPHDVVWVHKDIPE